MNKRPAENDKIESGGEGFCRWRPHPWHGLPVGPDPPRRVWAYIEMTSYDLLKYEIDKETGHLRIDRTLHSSSLPPSLYGFIPQTYCDEGVARFNPRADRGDRDPMDVCVICERESSRAEVIADARVIGGIRTLDEGLADDKIVAVLNGDLLWGDVTDLSDISPSLIDRLRHYFATYKFVPGEENEVEVQGAYGREDACRIVEAAMEDYRSLRWDR